MVLRDLAYGNGARQRLDVFRPVAESDKPAPILIHFHGGGWNSGSKSGYSFLGKAFAAQGLVTVLPNFGLHPEAAYPQFLEDCASAVAYVREQAGAFGADGNRIFLSGHSAGGYNAAMLALDDRWLKNAGVPKSAIAGWLGLAAPYDFLPLDVEDSIRTFSHVDDLPATQPINYVSKTSPPGFFANGAPDSLVGKYHVEHMAAVYGKLGLPHTAKIYPRMNHYWIMLSLARPFRSRFPVYRDMVDFIETTLGDR